MTHENAHWDADKKVLFVENISDRRDPTRVTKFWDVDPQLQIINLLKQQVKLLEKLLAREVPYHTGPQTVVVESPPPVPAPESPDEPI